MDRVRAALASLRTLFLGLPRIQQIAIVGATVAAIVVAGALLLFAQQPEMTVAFRNLDANDAAQITQKLKDSKINYELADNGQTIKVPATQAQDVKLQMAAAGLPQGGTVGWEIFNQSGLSTLGMTEFSQKVNLQRAMEGELSRTISKLDNIDSAQVRLVMPEDKLLTSQQKDPTAAVVVKMKQNGLEPVKQLTPEQVKSIQFLLSRSVEGLKPENVTVVDTNGTDLTEMVAQLDKQKANPQMTQQQRDFQKQIEDKMSKDLTAVLEKALGPNKAVVHVNATLNWDQVSQDSEYFVPPATVPDARPNVVRSQQTTTEKFAGPPAALPAGVPGTASNVGAGAQAAANLGVPGAPIAYENANTITNYEISKTTEKLTKTPGSIERLTVGVLLDGPLEEIQVQAIERLVAAQAGIKPERGDVVTVASMPFDRTLQDQQRRQMQEAAQLEFYYNMAKVGAAVLISLFVLLFLRSMLARPTVSSTVVGPQPLPGSVPGSEQGLVPYEGEDESYEEEAYYGDDSLEGPEEEEEPEEELPAPEMLEELEAPIEIPEIASPEEERIREMEERLREAQERRQALEEQVFNLARNNPEALADLIKTWLEEEEEARS